MNVVYAIYQAYEAIRHDEAKAKDDAGRSEGHALLALEGLNDHINSLAGLGDDEPPRAK